MWISAFLYRGCPAAIWIKLKVVQEAVWRPWIWRWSSSALSAGGTAWPMSRTKISSTAVERPNTREWFTSWGRLHFGHTTRPQITGGVGGAMAPRLEWLFFLTCCPLLLCLTLRWTRDRWLLLVRSSEKSRWVPVRPIPHSKNFPSNYDVSFASTLAYLPELINNWQILSLVGSILGRYVTTFWKRRNAATPLAPLLTVKRRRSCGRTWRTQTVSLDTDVPPEYRESFWCWCVKEPPLSSSAHLPFNQ